MTRFLQQFDQAADQLNHQVAPHVDVPLATPIPSAPPIFTSKRQRVQIGKYASWLAKQIARDTLSSSAQDRQAYIQNVSRTAKFRNKEIKTFAPFRRELSALQTVTARQFVTILLIGLLLLVGGIVFRLEMLTAMIALITVMYASNLLLNAIMTVKSLRLAAEEQVDDTIVQALTNADWPHYTILCPLYREAQIVPQFVRAMKALDYPADKLQILFLTEMDDIETRDAIRSLSLPEHFKIVTVPDGTPRTKPRACNYGLLLATGSYVVIFDAEDIPDPLQLKKAVLTFAKNESNVVCVQAKLNFYNTYQNVLTRWFTAEYSTWYDLVLPGLQKLGFSVPLGGTSNHFRTAALRALGGWDAYNVTEDCDLGLRLARSQLKTVILNSTTYEEANSQVKNWVRQRSRWIKGYMQTYLVHMRHPFDYLKQKRWRDLLSFQYIATSGAAVQFLNPLMWLLLAVYVFFRPWVADVYYILFPRPILYIGAFCLIFGNFFYVYLYLMACMKRRQYRLIPWVPLIPLYWALASIAGFMALFELIVKPHYWQKTIHGLHLAPPTAAAAKLQPAAPLPAQAVLPLDEEHMVNAWAKLDKNEEGDVPSIEASLTMISTLPLPVLSLAQIQTMQHAQRIKVHDLWHVATIIITCLASVSACIYFFLKHQILLYNDAFSHMRIARSVFDSATPGIAQLGGIWLPLPHILMLPFIWNDFLWHSGLAGSFVGMVCYVISARYLYLSARQLTKNRAISFTAALVFILNPNILYLQATPLSELVCICMLTTACYYFLMWTQKDTLNYLILAAGATFLATLARYDGWALFAALFVFIAIVGLLKRQRIAQISAHLIVFSILGGFGIVLWLIWNKIIFGDPLFFQHSAFSSQASQTGFLQSGTLYAYHNLWMALKTYTLNAMETTGSVIFIGAAIGFVVYFSRRRLSPEMLATLAFAVPFGFYILSLYTGQAIIWVPGSVPATANVQLFNVRYGSEAVIPAALFLATLVARIYEVFLQRRVSIRVRMMRLTSQSLFSLVVLAQVVFIISGGAIALQDGEFGLSCAQPHLVNVYLAEHYAGGKILQDVTTGDYSLSETGIDFKNTIYDGSGQLWQQAIAHPEQTVNWIVVARQDPNDFISKLINLDSPSFKTQFTLVMQDPSGISLYYRNNGTPLTTHSAPSSLLTDHSLCRIGMSGN